MSRGRIEVATPFGKTLGFGVEVFPLEAPSASAPDFGDFVWPGNLASQNVLSTPNAQISRFTPTSLYFQASSSNVGTGAGNTKYFLQQYGHHVAATLELPSATPYSFEAIPGFFGGLSVPAGHAPTLTGPGGQVITLDAAKTGTLAAGQWAFQFDYQRTYASATESQALATSPSFAAFQLVLPEPAGGLLALVGIGAPALLRRQRRRSSHGPDHRVIPK